jgi:hypothetical protein
VIGERDVETKRRDQGRKDGIIIDFVGNLGVDSLGYVWVDGEE